MSFSQISKVTRSPPAPLAMSQLSCSCSDCRVNRLRDSSNSLELSKDFTALCRTTGPLLDERLRLVETDAAFSGSKKFNRRFNRSGQVNEANANLEPLKSSGCFHSTHLNETFRRLPELELSSLSIAARVPEGTL